MTSKTKLRALSKLFPFLKLDGKDIANTFNAVGFGDLRWYMLLICLVLFLYWPLTFGVFALKNDALVYFLPYRYNISEAMQNGSFPFWSPFLYTGLPLHADMQSGVWNPLVWLFSMFGTYDLNTLHWETLVYYCIGAVGVFKLSKYFHWKSQVAIILSFAYSSSGFMFDSASFTAWVCSAAYLPFCLLYLLQLRDHLSLESAIKLAFACWLFFVSGYPSFFIISAYLIVVFAAADILIWFVKQNKDRAILYLKLLVSCFFIWLLLCGPALISYIGFFPYYQRGTGITLEDAQFNSFELQNISSFFLSSASYKLAGKNDISGRNAYCGIFIFVFIVYSIFRPWKTVQKVFGGIALFCLLFSLGPVLPVRSFFYNELPLMDTFRHPSSVRIFSILSLVLLAGFGMNQWFCGKNNRLVKKSIILTILFTILSVVILFATKGFKLEFFVPESYSPGAIKAWLGESSVTSWILAIATLQIGVLFFLYAIVSRRAFLLISIGHTFLISWLAMPFTLVSQYSSKQVNSFLHSFANGYPNDSIRLPVLGANDRIFKHTFGYSAFYEKRISIQDEIVTPTINTNYLSFLGDVHAVDFVKNRPVAFLNREGDTVDLLSAGPNHFKFEVNSSALQQLYFTQQFNRNWQCSINGENEPITLANKAFISVPVKSGKSIVEFQYKPKWVTGAIPIAIVTFILSLVYLNRYRFTRKQQLST